MRLVIVEREPLNAETPPDALAEPLTRPLGVLQRRRKVLTRAARAFLDVLRQAA